MKGELGTIHMEYLSFVTPRTVKRVLKKHRSERFIDAKELASTITEKPGQGIYDAYYDLISCGVEPGTAALICGDINRLHVGRRRDGRWEPDVLAPDATDRMLR